MTLRDGSGLDACGADRLVLGSDGDATALAGGLGSLALLLDSGSRRSGDPLDDGAFLGCLVGIHVGNRLCNGGLSLGDLVDNLDGVGNGLGLDDSVRLGVLSGGCGNAVGALRHVGNDRIGMW